MNKFFYGFVALMITMGSCKKEVSLETNGQPILETEWSFKEGLSTYDGPMDSAHLFSESNVEELIITGTTTDGKGQVLLQMVAEKLKAGVYSNPQVLFQYSESNVPLLQNIPANIGEFSITIATLDSFSVSGTFTGKVKDSASSEKTVIEGRFTAPLIYHIINPQPILYGELTVWSKSLCSGDGNIEVKVSDKSGAITQFFDSEPFCGASGTADFPLPVGTYTVKAFCGVDSVEYQIQIMDNNCTLLEIDFNNPPVIADYFPTGIGSTWAYQGVAGTESIESVANATFESKQYQQFNSSSGRTSYYRKDGNNYYEYLPLDFGSGNPSAQKIEFLFLKDNTAAGESWLTDAYDVQVSGTPVRVKLKCTIISKGFSESFGGKVYDDLIEVYTELLVYDGVNFQPVSAYTTIYAKGVGRVYYTNPTDNSEWVLQSSTIVP